MHANTSVSMISLEKFVKKFIMCNGHFKRHLNNFTKALLVLLIPPHRHPPPHTHLHPQNIGLHSLPDHLPVDSCDSRLPHQCSKVCPHKPRGIPGQLLVVKPLVQCQATTQHLKDSEGNTTQYQPCDQ